MNSSGRAGAPSKATLAFATLGGLGYAPVAPGTVGTLGAVVIHYFLLASLPLLSYILLWLIIFELGCYLSHQIMKWRGEDDPQVIVIDEALGYWVAMFAVPATPLYILAGFLLFRFFDIIKPWPANYFDKKVRNGFGIVMDDVIAGIFTNLILQLIKILSG